MAWQDRVKAGAYISAQGNRIEFEFEDVSLGFNLRGSAYEFPDAEGTLVQRTGNSSRRYPLRIFFSGDDHDLRANDFEDLLRVQGVGRLEHPFYGTIEVVPFGDVGRRDDLKSAGNQTVFEVTFWATIDTVYPASQDDPGSKVLSALGEYGQAAANWFLESTNLSGTGEQAQLKGTYTALQNSVVAGLSTIADATDSVRDEFQSIDDSINASIDLLIRDPLTLASQTIALIEVPSRAAATITDRLSAYRDLARIITEGDDAIQQPGFSPQPSNDFHTRDLYVSTYVAGAVRAVVNNEFLTRPDALGAADFLLDFMEETTNWRDDNYTSLGETETGAQYQQLQEAVAIAAGFLVEISFSLKQERSMILTRGRTPVDLCAELYGEVDDVLDFFSESNNLSWQEHLEINRGRRIVYYV